MEADISPPLIPLRTTPSMAAVSGLSGMALSYVSPMVEIGCDMSQKSRY